MNITDELRRRMPPSLSKPELEKLKGTQGLDSKKGEIDLELLKILAGEEQDPVTLDLLRTLASGRRDGTDQEVGAILPEMRASARAEALRAHENPGPGPEPQNEVNLGLPPRERGTPEEVGDSLRGIGKWMNDAFKRGPETSPSMDPAGEEAVRLHDRVLGKKEQDSIVADVMGGPGNAGKGRDEILLALEGMSREEQTAWLSENKDRLDPEAFTQAWGVVTDPGEQSGEMRLLPDSVREMLPYQLGLDKKGSGGIPFNIGGNKPMGSRGNMGRGSAPDESGVGPGDYDYIPGGEGDGSGLGPEEPDAIVVPPIAGVDDVDPGFVLEDEGMTGEGVGDGGYGESRVPAEDDQSSNSGWFSKLKSHLGDNWKKYAAGAGLALGAMKSDEFGQGLGMGAREGLEKRHEMDMFNAKLRNEKAIADAKFRQHQMGMLQTTPKEVREEVKDYVKGKQYQKIIDASTNWKKLEASVNDNSPIGDIGAMFGFISGLDDTAVRDGERAMILGAGSLGSKIKYYLGMEEGDRGYIQGNQLSAEQIKGIKRISKMHYDAQVDTFRGHREDYIDAIQRTDPNTDYSQYFKDPSEGYETGQVGEGSQRSSEAYQSAAPEGAIVRFPSGKMYRHNGRGGFTEVDSGTEATWTRGTAAPSSSGAGVTTNPSAPTSSVSSRVTGNIPQRNNNQGNVKIGGTGDQYAVKNADGTPKVDKFDHLIFASPEDGEKALRADLEAKMQGRSKHGKWDYLAEMGPTYATDPKWAERVGSILFRDHKIDSTKVKLKDIPIDALMDAVSKQEGYLA